MKKILVVLVMFCMVTLTSCSRALQFTNKINEESKKIESMSEEIIRCLTENDQDGFIALFCEKIRETGDFDSQIENVFAFFKCDSYLRSEINTTAGGGGITEFGKKIEWYVTPEITYIEVLVIPDGAYDQMCSRYYRVDYYYQITDKNHPEREGLHYFAIELINLDDCAVVGTWPSE